MAKDKKPPDPTTQLKEMVQHQPKTVVSRTVLKKDSGNVTIFAFDKGQGLSEHTASFDALVYIIEGEAEFTLGEDVRRLKMGDFIIMLAGTPHSARAITPFKMLLILLK